MRLITACPECGEIPDLISETTDYGRETMYCYCCPNGCLIGDMASTECGAEFRWDDIVQEVTEM